MSLCPCLRTQGPSHLVNPAPRRSRSGRTALAKGKTSLKVTLGGVTSASKVFAVLASNASGRYVRAVVPTTGSFTVYLNTSLAATAYVTWFVLD